MVNTTIKLTKELKDEMDKNKVHPRETYADYVKRIMDELKEANSYKTRVDKAMRKDALSRTSEVEE